MAKHPTGGIRSANRLLGRIAPGDFRRLNTALVAVTFKPKQVIHKFGAPITSIYFPEIGIISAMTVMDNGSAIEVATIGNEGLVGLTAAFGDRTSPQQMMVQVAGHGLRLDVATFMRELKRSPSLQDTVNRYHTAFGVQVSYAVACNGLHTIDKRCCRWLLMAQDRVQADVVPLTHEFLSIMLGVRRPSITEVLRPLEDSGLVKNGRGRIQIVDRAGLEARACECYRAVQETFHRLLGPS